MSDPNQRNTSSLQRKSFLITCWQERERAGGKVKWRFRLETAGSKLNEVFLSLDSMKNAIEQELMDLQQ